MGFFQTSGILNRRGFFGGAAKAFSPADIAGLQLWLDATTGLFDSTSGGSAVTTDGSAVARWEDQSGNKRDFKQTTLNNRPILKTLSQNSKNVIRFDAINDFMEMDLAFSGLTSASYFIALKLAVDPPTESSKTGHPICFLNGPIAGNTASHYTWTDGNIYDNTMTGSARRTVGNPAPNLSNFHLYNVQAGASGWTALLNKSQLFTTSTNTFSQIETKIGRSSAGGSTFYYFNGDIGEIVVYDSILSSFNRANVEDYLYSKWGIT